MYFEKVKKFYQTLINSEHFRANLQNKLYSIHNKKEYKIFVQNELLPLAKTMGYDLSVDDILSYENQILQQLSEKELENVIGGMGLMKETTIFISALAIIGGVHALQSINSVQTTGGSIPTTSSSTTASVVTQPAVKGPTVTLPGTTTIVRITTPINQLDDTSRKAVQAFFENMMKTDSNDSVAHTRPGAFFTISNYISHCTLQGVAYYFATCYEENLFNLKNGPEKADMLRKTFLLKDYKLESQQEKLISDAVKYARKDFGPSRYGKIKFPGNQTAISLVAPINKLDATSCDAAENFFVTLITNDTDDKDKDVKIARSRPHVLFTHPDYTPHCTLQDIAYYFATCYEENLFNLQNGPQRAAMLREKFLLKDYKLESQQKDLIIKAIKYANDNFSPSRYKQAVPVAAQTAAKQTQISSPAYFENAIRSAATIADLEAIRKHLIEVMQINDDQNYFTLPDLLDNKEKYLKYGNLDAIKALIQDDMKNFSPTTSIVPYPNTAPTTPENNGLFNFGNSCYFNSAIQQLYRDREFRSFFNTLPTRQQLNPEQKAIYSYLTQIFQVLDNKKGHPISESREWLELEILVNKLRSFIIALDEAAINAQMDADSVYSIISIKFDYHPLRLKSQITAKISATEMIPKAPKIDTAEKLQLALPRDSKSVSVQQLLYDYSKPETLTGDDQIYNPKDEQSGKIPEKVTFLNRKEIKSLPDAKAKDDAFQAELKKYKVDGTRIISLVDENLPATLTLQLKRFRHIPNEPPQKITNPIDLTPEINLNICCLSQKKLPSYRLVGIIKHTGILNGGHYTSYVLQDDTWYHINDAVTTKMPDDSFLDSDDLKQNAYILRYERVDQHVDEPSDDVTEISTTTEVQPASDATDTNVTPKESKISDASESEVSDINYTDEISRKVKEQDAEISRLREELEHMRDELEKKKTEASLYRSKLQGVFNSFSDLFKLVEQCHDGDYPDVETIKKAFAESMKHISPSS